MQLIDENGRNVPQLVAVAQRLGQEYHLSGRLRETREQSPELQNLVTVRLVLDVTITKGGAVTTAFVLQSRGGGFQPETARVQALERMTAAFAERLGQEAP